MLRPPDPRLPGALLVKLAQASLKNKRALLIPSLEGFYSEHFRWLLSEALRDLKLLDGTLEQVDQRLAKALQPHADLILRLCTIPGFDFTAGSDSSVGGGLRHEALCRSRSSGQLGGAVSGL